LDPESRLVVSDVIVAKIGGSTLGSYDTTLADVVELQRRGLRPVVVHGGGALISEWLARHNVPTRFEGGLRVTDEASLEVVVAVLAGLVNKEIVASLSALGGRAVGLCGADGGLLKARVLDEKLGFVGEVTGVESALITSLLNDGLVPVVAPIALQWEGEQPTAQLLNINADTAAGAIAAAIGARRLVFLTDVPGVRGGNGAIASRLPLGQAETLIESGVIEGGMIPKVQACIAASKSGCEAVIVDGRGEHCLLQTVEGRAAGTVIG
jgi:acetylglutamate kinase